jgi:hypothetical protein
MLEKETLQGGLFQERRSASAGHQQLAVTTVAAERALPEAETVVPPEKEVTMPTPSRRFSWSTLVKILIGAFVLGIAVASGAVAIGAHVLNVWPHGFPLYAMVIGGGVTMTLTAALMTAVFYSDTSGHDEDVYQFHPEKRRPSEPSE